MRLHSVQAVRVKEETDETVDKRRKGTPAKFRTEYQVKLDFVIDLEDN